MLIVRIYPPNRLGLARWQRLRVEETPYGYRAVPIEGGWTWRRPGAEYVGTSTEEPEPAVIDDPSAYQVPSSALYMVAK